ncbi:MAG: hypothetical protein DRQ78_00075 [Epsilonproteobacteria bacterium]|nr:MAG: hypothetical protein DRQ78_00075 [Campylobacterota bacterium]
MATFHSFSGVDIHAVFGDVQFGELQMVSYKSDREKAPVYVMGSPDPRTIARGKRLITGALVFVVFQRDSLLEAMNAYNGANQPYLSKEETANYVSTTPVPGGSENVLIGGIDGTNVGGANGRGTAVTEQGQANLADQLLPFDVTLVGANEYGKATKMVIHGIELMSEAGGISIDDLVIEKQMSFIARKISNWDNQGINPDGSF